MCLESIFIYRLNTMEVLLEFELDCNSNRVTPISHFKNPFRTSKLFFFKNLFWSFKLLDARLLKNNFKVRHIWMPYCKKCVIGKEQNILFCLVLL